MIWTFTMVGSILRGIERHMISQIARTTTLSLLEARDGQRRSMYVLILIFALLCHFPYIIKRPAPPTQNFRDGMPVLAGFVLSDKSVAEDRWLDPLSYSRCSDISQTYFRFPLPDVPSGWKPDPNRVWGKENVSNDRPAASEPTSHSKWKSGISADQVSAVFFAAYYSFQ